MIANAYAETCRAMPEVTERLAAAAAKEWAEAGSEPPALHPDPPAAERSQPESASEEEGGKARPPARKRPARKPAAKAPAEAKAS